MKRILLAIALPLLGFLVAAPAEAADGTARGEAIEDFGEVDQNSDGRIDRQEYHRRMSDMYFHADKNKNGSLDRAELDAIQEEMVLDPGDANADGELAMPEYIDERFEQFRAIDTNSDGLLTQDEVIRVYEKNWN